MNGGMGRLQYYKLYPDVEDLRFSTKGAACFDLRAYLVDGEHIRTRWGPLGQSWSEEDESCEIKNGVFVLNANARALIPTGMVLDIPAGYSVRIHPRSGASFYHGLSLSNCEGIIDSDYVEEVFISVINHSMLAIEIDHNERIAQAELVRNNYYIFKELDERPEKKSERAGGFGSTGTDELNTLMMEQRKIIDAGKKRGKYRTAEISVDAREKFMLGVDPAWHEYKGPIKQEDY